MVAGYESDLGRLIMWLTASPQLLSCFGFGLRRGLGLAGSVGLVKQTDAAAAA